MEGKCIQWLKGAKGAKGPKEALVTSFDIIHSIYSYFCSTLVTVKLTFYKSPFATTPRDVGTKRTTRAGTSKAIVRPANFTPFSSPYLQKLTPFLVLWAYLLKHCRMGICRGSKTKPGIPG